MKLHQSSLLLSYLLVCAGSAGGFLVQQGCSPSSCGQLQDIRYLFRLKDDPPNCGDPNYELICDANKTVLDFNSAKFYVRSISYVKETVNVVDVSLSGGGCVSFPSETILPLTYYAADVRFRYWGDGWASFVECREEMQNNKQYWPVPCLNRNKTFTYVVFGYQVSYLAPLCRFLTIVPSVYDGVMYTGTDEVFKLLPEGFLLTWKKGLNCGSPSQMVNYCFKKAWNKADLEHRNGFHLLTTFVSDQMNFLTCLHDAKDQFCLSYATYRFGIVFAVLIDAVLLIVLAGLLGRFVFTALTVFAFLAYIYWKSRVPIDSVEKFLRNQESLTPTRYSYTEIITMTRHFKDKLGEGGFGSVYKGVLPGRFQVAVKVLGNSMCNGDDFISEVSTIGRIHHVNVVRLIGYSSEGSKRALVYEYLPKGSLDKYIFSTDARIQRPFTWDKLMDIALGIARGIDYLHRGCDMRILHFDIKPHNILLDNSFNPKVSDFGLAKLFPRDYSIAALSAARGTVGYIAPELISRSFGVISSKSDVYSFGMLLMEMAGGRRNVEPKAENSSQIYYPSWIYDQLDQFDQKSRVHDIIDDVIPVGEVERKLSIVGLWCIQTRPSDRPSISRVIEMLQAEVDTLEMPPKPFHSAETVDSVSTWDPSIESSSTLMSVISEQESAT